MNEIYLYVVLGIILFFSIAIFNIIVFKVNMAQAFTAPILMLMLGGLIFLIDDLGNEHRKMTAGSNQTTVKTDSPLEETIKNTPYDEIETDAIAQLSLEHQKKDGIKDEDYLFISKEEHQQTAYFDLVSIDKHSTDDQNFRFPAYVQYGDVKVPHVRYQLVKGEIFNAVVTLPKEE